MSSSSQKPISAALANARSWGAQETNNSSHLSEEDQLARRTSGVSEAAMAISASAQAPKRNFLAVPVAATQRQPNTSLKSLPNIAEMNRQISWGAFGDDPAQEAPKASSAAETVVKTAAAASPFTSATDEKSKKGPKKSVSFADSKNTPAASATPQVFKVSAPLSSPSVVSEKPPETDEELLKTAQSYLGSLDGKLQWPLKSLVRAIALLDPEAAKKLFLRCVIPHLVEDKETFSACLNVLGETDSKLIYGLLKNHLKQTPNTLRYCSESLVLDVLSKAECLPGEKELLYGHQQWNKKDYKGAFSHYENSVKEECPEAHLFLAQCYLMGNGVERNLESGERHLHLAEDAKLVEALTELGRHYGNGKSDSAGMHRYLNEAASMGSAEAHRLIGNCILTGSGIKVDPEAAFAHYQAAALLGSAQARTAVGSCLLRGRGTHRDDEKAFASFEEAARMGDPDAILESAQCLLDARGVREDSKKALDYIKSAIKYGAVEGWTHLGCYYHHGHGQYRGEEAIRQAEKAYRMAMNNGSVEAQCHLGTIYWIGAEPFKRNLSLALKHFEESANKGSVNAKRMLGKCFLREIEGKKDEKRAFQIFQELVEQGYSEALGDLARCYQTGCGVRKDETRAFALLLRAEGEGEIRFLVDLGKCYRDGLGTKLDRVKAKEAFQSASRHGNPHGIAELFEMIKDENIQEAEVLAWQAITEFGKSPFNVPQSILDFVMRPPENSSFCRVLPAGGLKTSGKAPNKKSVKFRSPK